MNNCDTDKLYILDIKGLVECLKNGLLTERMGFIYLTLNSLLVTLLFTTTSNTIQTLSDLLLAVIPVSIVLVGLLLAYRANVSGDNQEFLLRVVSISFVLSVRVALMVVLLFIGIGVIMNYLVGYNAMLTIIETNWFVVAVNVGSFLFFYTLLVKNIRDVAHGH